MRPILVALLLVACNPSPSELQDLKTKFQDRVQITPDSVVCDADGGYLVCFGVTKKGTPVHFRCGQDLTTPQCYFIGMYGS